MATKKIARTKRTNKAKPVPEGIRRAAARAGTTTATHYVAPFPGDPNPGKTLLDSLKASEWPGDHAEILRRFARSFEQVAADVSIERRGGARAEPVDAETEVMRAAARAGIEPTDPYTAAMEHVTSRFGEQIVKACDMLGEELASYVGDDTDGDDYNVKQALRVLWELRWELGISAVDGKAADHAVERAAERVKRKSNGAAAGSEVQS
jgi:hypothetical protein